MTPKQVCKYFGNLTAAAQALDLTRQAIYQWRRNGVIPWRTQTSIAYITGGALKADKRRRNGPRKTP